MNNKKLGLDFHGVIDKHPQVFSKLTRALIHDFWQVHIITGHEITPEFKRKLSDLDIRYTHLFSIIDHHRSIGTPIRYDQRGPWINTELWDKTKGEYCAEQGISLHIDDSDVYGKYFTTPYLQLRELIYDQD